MLSVSAQLNSTAVNSMIKIEVCYALPNHQQIIALEVEQGTTILEAIQQSGVLTQFPDIDLTKQKVGVFSKARALTDRVEQGDRIEIYRPLTIDPKEARRAKAKKKR